MCGICGVFDISQHNRIKRNIILKMMNKLSHRGPDGKDCYINGNAGFGFTRLSIIDLEGGMQPISSEDNSLVLICNGEIFNYIELRKELISKGHKFKTEGDVEVIIHLYQEKGTGLLKYLNGQFAFALYDIKKQQLFCARDHFGIIPLFYTIHNDCLIFGSEIKAILEFPGVERNVDLTGLDQIFSFPGLISPRTMFKNIFSLENGHFLVAGKDTPVENIEYWDIQYPKKNNIEYNIGEKYYIETLEDLIDKSIRLRLRSDVPVGLYISGGLDSSIVAAKTREITPHITRNTFSIDFIEKEISESYYQKIIHEYIGSVHNSNVFHFNDISKRLKQAVYHSECPIKETYNTASLALSEAVQKEGIKVVLSGEGADEFFAGYVGYKFDKMRLQDKSWNQANINENKMRMMLWGDPDFFYEKNYFSFIDIKRKLYSERIQEYFNDFNCYNHFIINKKRIDNIDIIHKRSYLDYKLRLVDHLISDHGDRMAMANSVEARYPFLDIDLIEFVKNVPQNLKLNNYTEKYILKKIGKRILPGEIESREKFAFAAPASPYLLKRNIEYINDLLSYDTIRKQGYFSPDVVEKLKQQYLDNNFTINAPFDTDLLTTVITFGIWLDEFKLSKN